MSWLDVAPAKAAHPAASGDIHATMPKLVARRFSGRPRSPVWRADWLVIPMTPELADYLSLSFVRVVFPMPPIGAGCASKPHGPLREAEIFIGQSRAIPAAAIGADHSSAARMNLAMELRAHQPSFLRGSVVPSPTFSLNHVERIIPHGPRQEMSPVETRRVVATVPNQESGRHLSVLERVRSTVDEDMTTAFASVIVAVLTSISSSWPRPANCRIHRFLQRKNAGYQLRGKPLGRQPSEPVVFTGGDICRILRFGHRSSPERSLASRRGAVRRSASARIKIPAMRQGRHIRQSGRACA